jgi:hypothetical protein
MTLVVSGIDVSNLLYLIFQQIDPVSVTLQRTVFTNHAMQFLLNLQLLG